MGHASRDAPRWNAVPTTSLVATTPVEVSLVDVGVWADLQAECFDS
jgi:hypothetical protein